MAPLPDEDMEERRVELIDWFDDLADDERATPDDFDYLWEELYEWGDTALDDKWNGKKVCWIEIVPRRSEPSPAAS